jgi:hypothetical protein
VEAVRGRGGFGSVTFNRPSGHKGLPSQVGEEYESMSKAKSDKSLSECK